MQAASALIAWTPAECAFTAACPALRRTAGSVAVIAWPDDQRRAQAYAKVVGACDEAWRARPPEALVASVFVAFNTMVLRDGISALNAHASLLDLDEYRDNVSPDLRLRHAVPVRTADVIDLASRLRG